MIVFEQSRKLWLQCGLSVENFPSTKRKVLNKVNKLIIFASQFSFLIGSMIFTWKNVLNLELFQMVYIALQNQWAILSVSLIVCIHLVEDRIRRMLGTCQHIVDARTSVETEPIYKEAERNIYTVTRWPKFVLQFNYLSSQTIICIAFIIRDFRRGHIDAAHHYYMAHL